MEAKRQNWNAQDYARHSSAQLGWAQELIGKLALRGDESLLDIGCGDGKITARLAELLPRGRVTGVDASPQMIALASSAFPPERYPNLTFAQMDATALSLAETFDVAFSNATLHWIADQEAVLRGVHKHQRTGGRVLFQLGGRGNADEVMAVMEEMMRLPAWERYYEGFINPYHFSGPEAYADWLPACGYRPRRIELIPKDMQHDGPEGLKGWLRTTWFPFTDRLPTEQREAFLDQLLATYLARRPLDAAGKTHVAMVRLEVEAEAI